MPWWLRALGYLVAAVAVSVVALWLAGSVILELAKTGF